MFRLTLGIYFYDFQRPLLAVVAQLRRPEAPTSSVFPVAPLPFWGVNASLGRRDDDQLSRNDNCAKT